MLGRSILKPACVNRFQKLLDHGNPEVIGRVQFTVGRPAAVTTRFRGCEYGDLSPTIRLNGERRAPGRGFRTLGVVCETLAAASRLIDLMPGNEDGVIARKEL
jgi:hypothetical protein